MPASILQEQVEKLAPEGTRGAVRHTGLAGGPIPSAREYRPERYSLRERDSAADVILRLEHSLGHSPTQQPTVDADSRIPAKGGADTKKR